MLFVIIEKLIFEEIRMRIYLMEMENEKSMFETYVQKCFRKIEINN